MYLRPRKQLVLIALLLVLLGCTREELTELPFVETVDPIIQELNMVKLNGIIREFEGSVQEHGFVVSTTQTVPELGQGDVQDIRLGPRSVTRDEPFAFDFLDPDLEALHYYRAFIIFDNRPPVYGDVATFSLQITVDFQEVLSVRNDTAIVRGRILGLERLRTSVQHYGHVYSSTNSNPVVAIDDTTDLGASNDDLVFLDTLTNLAFNTEYSVRTYIKAGNAFVYSTPKTFRVVDGWKEKMPMEARVFGGVAVTIRNKAYVGLGCGLKDDNCNRSEGFDARLFEFDPGGNDGLGSWRPLSPFPGRARYRAVAFAIGDVMYYGLGSIDGQTGDPPITFDDLWQYDPITNLWDSVGVTGDPRLRGSAASFVINQKAYIGLGFIGDIDRRGFYEFDPAGNPQWRRVEDWPADAPTRRNALAFTLNNEGYVGTGRVHGTNTTLSDFWKFTPNAGLDGKGEWIQVASLSDCPIGSAEFCNRRSPAKDCSRLGSTAFVISDRAYVATGSQLNDASGVHFWDLHEYEPGADRWIRKTFSHPGGGRGDGIAFTLSDKGYVGLGIRRDCDFLYTVFNSLWEYTPEIN